MNVDSVYPQIRDIIADVLVIDKEDISLDSRLISDLNAESIDFLDLVFQLEKEFNIKIPRGQLEKNARGDLTEAEFEKGGFITEKGMAALKNYLNEVPAQHFKNHMKISEIPLLFTVKTFCKLVVSATNDKPTTETID